MAKSEQGGEKKSSGAFLGLVMVTLLAAGGGGGFGFYLSGSLKGNEAAAKPAAAPKAGEKPSVPSGAKIVEMAPIIANLAEPKSAWMRIEASLVIDGELEGAPALAGKIAEDIVAYLKTMSLAQFEGGSGFQNLREDLNERARVRGGSQVREIVIHGVIVE
jgi:flagellar FliL protein